MRYWADQRGGRITPQRRELLIKVGSKVSFAKATELANYLAPRVNAMTVWHVLQEVGEVLHREVDERQTAIFEKQKTLKSGYELICEH